MKYSFNRSLLTSLALGLVVVSPSLTYKSMAQTTMDMPSKLTHKPDSQMKAVLDQLKALKPKPIEKLKPAQARKQPGPADAVKALVIKKKGMFKPEAVGSVVDKMVPGPAGMVPVRVYTPKGSGPFPVIAYFHGGGFVIASVTAYDSSARALANATNAIVVAVAYRMAPEHKLPAAHEDCYAVTQWLTKNADKWNGDPKRVAVAGESAGGNLATDMCLMAKMRGGTMPVYQMLVYPVVQGKATQSYRDSANAKPLNRAMMGWFFHYALPSKAFGKTPLASPLYAPDALFKGLPPATIIGAEIDPLRSEGIMYAQKLAKNGIPVRYKLYPGVTHEFFGMGAVVDKAKDAVQFAAAGLKMGFNK